MIRRLRRLRIEPMPSQKRAARTSTDPMPSSPAVKAPARRRPDRQQIASDYLRAVALVLLGWAWTRVGQVPGAGAGRWRPAQDAYWCWVFPELEMRLTLIKDTLARLDMPENHTP